MAQKPMLRVEVGARASFSYRRPASAKKSSEAERRLDELEREAVRLREAAAGAQTAAVSLGGRGEELFDYRRNHNIHGTPYHEVRGDVAVLAPRAAVTAQEKALLAALLQRVSAVGGRWVLLVPPGGAGDAARAAWCGARRGGRWGGAAA